MYILLAFFLSFFIFLLLWTVGRGYRKKKNVGKPREGVETKKKKVGRTVGPTCSIGPRGGIELVSLLWFFYFISFPKWSAHYRYTAAILRPQSGAWAVPQPRLRGGTRVL